MKDLWEQGWFYSLSVGISLETLVEAASDQFGTQQSQTLSVFWFQIPLVKELMNLDCVFPPVRKESSRSPPPETSQDESSQSKTPTIDLEEEEKEEGGDQDSDEEPTIPSSEDFQNLR